MTRPVIFKQSHELFRTFHDHCVDSGGEVELTFEPALWDSADDDCCWFMVYCLFSRIDVISSLCTSLSLGLGVES